MVGRQKAVCVVFLFCERKVSLESVLTRRKKVERERESVGDREGCVNKC